MKNDMALDQELVQEIDLYFRRTTVVKPAEQEIAEEIINLERIGHVWFATDIAFVKKLLKFFNLRAGVTYNDDPHGSPEVNSEAWIVSYLRKALLCDGVWGVRMGDIRASVENVDELS